ncbi:thiamine ABC transporter substrate binding subunit [Salinibius halmophilus]|uniref:thiamine ABC transporter substrate binding subunit n=1 Tax=Salinibius halmophilus TaxID=1853216 RepID=UPI000E67131D|nr:thiamine ABC transporter substrate binding subunit [Salinibius halmophilus]
MQKQLLASIALVAGTAVANPLTIYTYDSFVAEWGPGPQIEANFEQKCGCDVEFVALADGVSLLNRLRIEGDDTKADIVLGIDNALLADARKTGQVAEHTVDTSELVVPGGWAHNDFVPFDYGQFAFVYDSERVSNPPTSLAELIDSDLSVVYMDPRTSTVGAGLLYWMKSVFGEQAGDKWAALADNTTTVTQGWSDAYYGIFMEGGADAVLSYVTSPAYHIEYEDETRFKAMPFSEGHYQQIEVAFVTHASQQAELANDFLQYLVSPEAQSIIPTTNWMFPVHPEAELPASFEQLITPADILMFDEDDVANERSNWVREWLNAAS